MWTPSSPLAAGLAAVGLTAAGLVAAATPSVALDDVTPPALVSYAASATSVDVTTTGRPVTVRIGVVDAGSGVATVRVLGELIGATSDPAALPVAGAGDSQATLISGTAQSGVWSAEMPLPAGTGGQVKFRVQLRDVAGNVVRATVDELVPTGQPALSTVVTAPPQQPTAVKGSTFTYVVGVGRNVTWTTKPGSPASTGYAVLSKTSACGDLVTPAQALQYIRFERINLLLPCTITLQVANTTGRSPAKSYTVW